MLRHCDRHASFTHRKHKTLSEIINGLRVNKQTRIPLFLKMSQAIYTTYIVVYYKLIISEFCNILMDIDFVLKILICHFLLVMI